MENPIKESFNNFFKFSLKCRNNQFIFIICKNETLC